MEMEPNGDGISIMVIDHDATALMSLAIMLEQYSYRVTTSELVSDALPMIRQDEGRFKLVMADLNLNDMTNLSFLLILHKMNIPFILMSRERDQNIGEKAIAFGATLYFEKPISMNDLRYLWQHVYRIRQPRFVAARRDASHGLDWKRNVADPKQNDDSTIKLNQDKSSKPPKARKTRLVWNEQLHRKFAAVLNALGHEKARPKSILRMMNEPNLTHRQISSHLQKHKAQLKRLNRASSSSVGFNTDASASFYSEAGYLYMQQNILNPPWSQKQKSTLGNQTLQLPNMSQSMYQRQNFSLGFDPNNSMNQTLQSPNVAQSMYQNLQFIPGSTSAGNVVNVNQISEPWTQTTPGSYKSVTEIDVGNQEMDTTGGGVTSAELLDNLKQNSPELAHLLKALDDEADDCMGSASEPHPAEVDQFCEWLKEAMQGNDDNPGGLGF